MQSQNAKNKSRSENHARAPVIAAFVKEMRESFGEDQVIVLMVSEGDFKFDKRSK